MAIESEPFILVPSFQPLIFLIKESTVNRSNHGLLSLLLCPLLFLVSAQTASAADSGLKDTAALSGVKVAKSVFMMDVKEPGRMAHVLKVIGETSAGIAKQGVKPELVVVVIGRSVAFLTKDRRGIPYTDQRSITQIHDAIGKLKSMSVRTEVCGIALRGMDVQPNALIADVTPVGNGYISAIGYQSQGYQLVPVY
jgi:intracellular sulfur oxidation DsrE/DsrF family protein